MDIGSIFCVVSTSQIDNIFRLPVIYADGARICRANLGAKEQGFYALLGLEVCRADTEHLASRLRTPHERTKKSQANTI